MILKFNDIDKQAPEFFSEYEIEFNGEPDCDVCDHCYHHFEKLYEISSVCDEEKACIECAKEVYQDLLLRGNT